MGEFNYTLPELFKITFGVPFIIPHQLPRTKVNYNSPALIEDAASASPQHGTSALGTLVYDTVVLQDNSGNKFQFPDVMLFDVSQAKNIVKTQIQGRNGTIKEFINLDDFAIRFRGLFSTKDSELPPDDDVRSQLEFWKKNESLDVYSDVLNNVFGIYRLVLTDVEWQQVEASLNCLAFTMSAISDDPEETTIKLLNLI